jgi:tetratricopeptide (TPR) repeat protein
MSQKLSQPTESVTNTRALRRRRAIQWSVGGAVVLMGVVGWMILPGSERRIARAELLLGDGKAKEALVALEPLLKATPGNGSACFLAGQAAVRLKTFAEAARWFEQVPAGHQRRAEACFRAADILLLQLYQLSPAESLLRETLRLQPDHQGAQGHLAGLYGLCGLTSLTTELRLERLYAGNFAEVDLMLLALGDTATENANSLSEYIQNCPDDPLVLLARAHQAWQQHDFATARALYEQGLAQRGDLDDAQARLGRILCETGDDAEFIKWHAQLATTAENHPETWGVRGDWSLRQSDAKGSVRCYWEAARRDATYRRAHHQLGQALSSLGEQRIAEAFQHRNAVLQELLLAAKHYGLESTSTSALRAVTAADACSQTWEAWGWAEAARHRPPKLSGNWPENVRPAPNTPRVLVTAQPALQHNLGHYPLPQWMQQPGQYRPPTLPEQNEVTAIHFTDDAALTGLRFAYVNGDDLPGPGMRMFQFSGGGVGVIDYDRDGWPDLYFTQGGRWPVPDANPPSDMLFRNRDGQSFENVSSLAGIIETDYSQGLTVGDIDCDGWPDLFIANVAGNRLFRNNGDGTFDDITPQIRLGENRWSTSVACADLNGDALPDLFVVNYLSGKDLLDRICRQENGVPRSCTPHEFEAAEDQVLLNLGDGRFRDVSAEAGGIAPGGKGLGVVAADFDGTGRLSLFVANDTTGNFFFQNKTAHPGDAPKFEENAIVTGLAFDREGRSQACMGIAADDANGDEQLDLFVTNYFNEANTLYQRQPGLMFLDTTSEAGLTEPSLKQLGFGTQFLDADLDGWPDLIVTNGHVDDETARGVPLHMPTQFFRNRGNGRFAEVAATQLGDWFKGKYLGRGLARLDWNRDGREDFAVNNLDSPAALLTNDSPPLGRYLAIELIGTVSAREPTGATIQVKTSTRSLSKQMTAGDGYMASNERRLTFGVGADEHVEVMIHWPSGRHDTFSGVRTEAAWLAIEGRPGLIQVDSRK